MNKWCVLMMLCATLAGALDVRSFSGSSNPLINIGVVCGIHPCELIGTAICSRWIALLEVNPPLAPVRVDLASVQHTGMAAQPLADPCWRGNWRGVDLNRDWPTVPNCWPSPPVDQGEAFAEEETIELANWLIKGQYDILIAIHSGAKAVLTPYDACDMTPENFDDAIRIAHWMTQYACPDCAIDTSPRVLNYWAIGTMTDYAHHSLGVPFVYTFEVYENRDALLEGTDCAAVFTPTNMTAEVEKWESVIVQLAHMNARDLQTLLSMVYKGNLFD